MKELIYILFLCVIGCAVCPPAGKHIVSITDEQASHCQLYCYNETDEFYQCPANIINEIL